MCQELWHPILPAPLLCFSWWLPQLLCSPACDCCENTTENDGKVFYWKQAETAGIGAFSREKAVGGR